MYHLAKSIYLRYMSKEEYCILLLGLDNAGKTTLFNQIKALFTLTSDNPATSSLDGAPPSSTAGNTVPTVGQNVTTISLPDMYLKIWDIGGQLSLRRLWTSYYRSAHAIIFVVDSTDIGSDIDLARLPGLIEAARRRGSIASLTSPTGDAGTAPGDFGGGGTVTSPTSGVGTSKKMDFGRLEEARQVLESVLQEGDLQGIPVLVLANKQDREDCVEVVRIKEGLVRPVFEGEKGGMVRDSRVLPVSALRGTGVKEAVEWVRSRVLWNREGRAPVMR